MKPLNDILKGRKTLCFIDLEGAQMSHEIIEIGAYKCQIREDGTIKRTYRPYKAYVRPKHAVGHFVTKLTGITEKQLREEGVPYREMLNGLIKYLGKDFQKTLFVAYGSQDASMFVASADNNMDASMEQSLFISKRTFDYCEFLGTFLRSESNNVMSLEHACEAFHIPFEGKAHDAVDDAKNLMLLYSAVLANQKLLAQYYKRTLSVSPKTPAPLRLLLRLLEEKKSIDVADFDAALEASLE